MPMWIAVLLLWISLVSVTDSSDWFVVDLNVWDLDEKSDFLAEESLIRLPSKLSGNSKPQKPRTASKTSPVPVKTASQKNVQVKKVAVKSVVKVKLPPLDVREELESEDLLLHTNVGQVPQQQPQRRDGKRSDALPKKAKNEDSRNKPENVLPAETVDIECDEEKDVGCLFRSEELIPLDTKPGGKPAKSTPVNKNKDAKSPKDAKTKNTKKNGKPKNEKERVKSKSKDSRKDLQPITKKQLPLVRRLLQYISDSAIDQNGTSAVKPVVKVKLPPLDVREELESEDLLLHTNVGQVPQQQPQRRDGKRSDALHKKAKNEDSRNKPENVLPAETVDIECDEEKDVGCLFRSEELIPLDTKPGGKPAKSTPVNKNKDAKSPKDAKTKNTKKNGKPKNEKERVKTESKDSRKDLQPITKKQLPLVRRLLQYISDSAIDQNGTSAVKPVVKVKLPPLDVREELESEDLLLHTNVGQVPQQQPQRRDGKRSDALHKKAKNEDSRNKPESVLPAETVDIECDEEKDVGCLFRSEELIPLDTKPGGKPAKSTPVNKNKDAKSPKDAKTKNTKKNGKAKNEKERVKSESKDSRKDLQPNTKKQLPLVRRLLQYISDSAIDQNGTSAVKPVVKVKLPPLDVREELESEDLLLHTNVGQVPQQQPQRRDGKRSDALPKKVKNEDSRNKPESVLPAETVDIECDEEKDVGCLFRSEELIPLDTKPGGKPAKSTPVNKNKDAKSPKDAKTKNTKKTGKPKNENERVKSESKDSRKVILPPLDVREELESEDLLLHTNVGQVPQQQPQRRDGKRSDALPKKAKNEDSRNKPESVLPAETVDIECDEEKDVGCLFRSEELIPLDTKRGGKPAKSTPVNKNKDAKSPKDAKTKNTKKTEDPKSEKERVKSESKDSRKVKLPPLDVREELESEDLLLHTNVGQVPQQQLQRRDGKRSDALPKTAQNEDSRNKPENVLPAETVDIECDEEKDVGCVFRSEELIPLDTKPSGKPAKSTPVNKNKDAKTKNTKKTEEPKSEKERVKSESKDSRKDFTIDNNGTVTENTESDRPKVSEQTDDFVRENADIDGDEEDAIDTVQDEDDFVENFGIDRYRRAVDDDLQTSGGGPIDEVTKEVNPYSGLIFKLPLTITLEKTDSDGNTVPSKLGEEDVKNYKKAFTEVLKSIYGGFFPGFKDVKVNDVSLDENGRIKADYEVQFEFGSIGAKDLDRDERLQLLLGAMSSIVIPEVNNANVSNYKVYKPSKLDPTVINETLLNLLSDPCVSLNPCPDGYYNCNSTGSTAICTHKCFKSDFTDRCQNGATCKLTDSFEPFCTCTKKFTGRYCEKEKSANKGLTTPEIVGVSVGSLIVLAALCSCGVFLLCCRRKSAKDMDYTYFGDEEQPLEGYSDQSSALGIRPVYIDRPRISPAPMDIYSFNRSADSSEDV